MSVIHRNYLFQFLFGVAIKNISNDIYSLRKLSDVKHVGDVARLNEDSRKVQGFSEIAMLRLRLGFILDLQIVKYCFEIRKA